MINNNNMTSVYDDPRDIAGDAARLAIRAELAALKAQPSGVVLPEWLESSRAFADRLYAAGWRDHADAQHAGAAGMYDELIASLNSSPVSAGEPVYQFQCREIGEGDWEPCKAYPADSHAEGVKE